MNESPPLLRLDPGPLRCHVLRSEHWVSRPVKEVFAFFERPENLAKITPPNLDFRILTPSPVSMRAGAQIDYTIRILGCPLRWTTIITRYEPPYLFADEQARGPYRYWRHTHRFEEQRGGTLMSDEVVYALPLWPLSEVAHLLSVRRMIQSIFDYRTGAIDQEFSAEPSNGKRSNVS